MKEMHQELSERSDPSLAVFGKNLRKWLSWIQIILVQMDRLQFTAVYCNRRGCQDNTSKDPFSRCKCAIIGYRKEMTITEYSLTTTTKVNCKIQKERNLYSVLRLRGDTELHQWQRDHQDPERLQHSAHEHWHVSAQFFLVRFLS